MPGNNNYRGGGRTPVLLNVAEKPSVARSLAAVFHRMPQSREGAPMRREAAQIFTHENVVFPDIFTQANGRNGNSGNGNNRPHKMITTSVRGHLAGIEFGPEHGWSRCDPIQLFEAPLHTLVPAAVSLADSKLSELDAAARQIDARVQQIGA